MSKFMFVYRRPAEAGDQASPEDMQKVMEKWQSWIREGMQKGWLLDRGNGLTQEGCIVDARKVVLDGPFVESKEVVGGYSVVQADTISAAAEIAKGCPILLTGGNVEVRGLWEPPG
jgi:hypothetical protein